MYSQSYFWKLDIVKQIEYLKNINLIFMSLFDGSKTQLYFHVKLKMIELPNIYHIDEMINRLSKTFNLFKSTFFEKNNILLLSSHQFIELSFPNMIKYTEYIFIKINSIMRQYIAYFELYENYRQHICNIVNPMPYVDINIVDVLSDMDPDDIIFMLK